MTPTDALTYAGHFTYQPVASGPRYRCEVPTDLHAARCQELRAVALLPAYRSTLDLTLARTRLHLKISITPRRGLHDRHVNVVSCRGRAALDLRWNVLPQRAAQVFQGLDETLLANEYAHEKHYRFRTPRQDPNSPLVQRAALALPRSVLRADPPSVASIERFLNTTVDDHAYGDTRIAYRLIILR